MAKAFDGVVRGRVVEMRFAFSGQVSSVRKRKGEAVKRGELLASLDKKILQAELDRQLADFERVRADFEIFNLKTGEPGDDITKYLKSAKQAALNASVKEVELAKAKLDQADLFSPATGLILDDHEVASGLNITPSSCPFEILEEGSLYFEIEIDQKELPLFSGSVSLEVEFPHLKKTYLATGRKAILPKYPAKFLVNADFKESQGLVFGLIGRAKVI